MQITWNYNQVSLIIFVRLLFVQSLRLRFPFQFRQYQIHLNISLSHFNRPLFLHLKELNKYCIWSQFKAFIICWRFITKMLKKKKKIRKAFLWSIFSGTTTKKVKRQKREKLTNRLIHSDKWTFSIFRRNKQLFSLSVQTKEEISIVSETVNGCCLDLIRRFSYFSHLSALLGSTTGRISNTRFRKIFST